MKRDIKRRSRAGVEEFRCTNCLEWKPRDAFYRRKEAYGSPFGITGHCRVCTNVKRRVRDARNRETLLAQGKARRAAIRAQIREADKNHRKNRKKSTLEFLPRFVEREKVLEIVDALLLAHENDLGMAAHAAGTTPRTLYAIRTGERPTLRWEVAEKIAMAANMQDQFLAHFPIPGKDGWNKQGDRFCRHCGRWDIPHRGRGYCYRCGDIINRWRKRGMKIKQPKHERWMRSDEFASCIRCKTREHKHQGHGLCRPCYYLVVDGAVHDGERYRTHMRVRREQGQQRRG